MKQGKKLLTGATLMLALSAGQANAASPLISFSPANAVVADNTKLVSKRPAEADRLFVSDAVEKKIKEVKKLLKNNKSCMMLIWEWWKYNYFSEKLDERE